MLKRVTICLMTCGEETEEDCHKAILPTILWNEEIHYDQVRNLTPASHALNTMIGRCPTPYLIPLDSDVLVYPRFWERVKSALDRHEDDPTWHSILFPLWDTLTQEKIMSLKIFRTKAVREVPYKDDPCPDILHYDDLTVAGWSVISKMDEEPIGDHVVRGNFFCYAKYRDLYTVARAHPDRILESHFKGGTDLKSRSSLHLDFFRERYRQTDNDDYLYCIAGMVEGLTSPLRLRSKDLADRQMRIPVSEAETLYSRWSGRSKRVFL